MSSPFNSEEGSVDWKAVLKSPLVIESSTKAKTNPSSTKGKTGEYCYHALFDIISYLVMIVGNDFDQVSTKSVSCLVYHHNLYNSIQACLYDVIDQIFDIYDVKAALPQRIFEGKQQHTYFP